MQIAGFFKTTLLDYPGHVASAIFLKGCNFCCPFCHNKDLVLISATPHIYDENIILTYLKKRQNILDGVCISGGEPTISSNLIDFIEKIHHIGLKIKLDTNGYEPDLLKEICKTGYINYIAMDIKSSKQNYADVCGLPEMDLHRIQSSIDFIMNNDIDYEFRTTVIKEFHREEHFQEIGEWIKGANAYYLQKYIESNQAICFGYHAYAKKEMDYFKTILSTNIANVEIRGMVDGE